MKKRKLSREEEMLVMLVKMIEGTLENAKKGDVKIRDVTCDASRPGVPDVKAMLKANDGIMLFCHGPDCHIGIDIHLEYKQ